MAEEDFDIGEEVSALAPEDKLNQLHGMAESLTTMNTAIESTAAQLEAMKSERHSLRIGEMPRLMNDLNMPSFVYKGWQFELDDLVTGSFPKDPHKRAQAIELLRKYNAEGLLVAQIEIMFPKSEYDIAELLYKFLEFCGYTTKLSETINTQTYNAFARRRLEAGEEIDIEGLGMYHNKIVKPTVAKEKKPRKKFS